jgi:uncharacterized damage-inducible protein DinB
VNIDRKPPRLAAGERETLMTLWQYHRESVVRKVEGLDADAASRRLVDSGTTLLWLVRHLARAESLWILGRFAGEHSLVADEAGPADDTIEAAVAAYRAMWTRVDDVVHDHDLDDLARGDDMTPTVNLRWIVAHLLEETARHAGHADILREQIDGQLGR